MYGPDNAGKVVNAFAIIHNTLVHYRLSIQPFEDCIEQEPVGGNNRINENHEIEDRRGVQEEFIIFSHFIHSTCLLRNR